MDQKSLHQFHAKLKLVKPAYFFVPAIIATGVCILALRQNNLQMVTLRQELYAADESGQHVDVALNKLRSYVHSHMNTSLSTGEGIYPPIQLKHTYQRLLEAQSPSSENAKVYQDAQAFCEQQNPSGFSGRGRVPCIEQYVAEHGATSTMTSQSDVPSDMYKFDFVSPSWSPDLAGWSMVVSLISWAGFFIRVGLGVIAKTLKR